MLSKENKINLFNFMNRRRKSENRSAIQQSIEHEFSRAYTLDERDPVDAMLSSYYGGGWRDRKTMFQYSSLFSDQYISAFSKTTLIVDSESEEVTVYIHFYECSKNKVLKLTKINRGIALGRVLDIVSKYPIVDLIVMTNTGKIIDKSRLGDYLMTFIRKYGISNRTLHFYVQIPGTNKPSPPFRFLGKYYEYFNFFI